MEKPDSEAAFTVRTPDGRYLSVYADGRIKGFPQGSVIFNRIPLLINQARAESTNRPQAA